MFGLCELYGMEITDLRKELGLSQEAFAALIGLKSKGHVSDLERTKSASVAVALEIERLSAGRIAADSLNRDVALVRASSEGESASEAA